MSRDWYRSLKNFRSRVGREERPVQTFLAKDRTISVCSPVVQLDMVFAVRIVVRNSYIIDKIGKIM